MPPTPIPIYSSIVCKPSKAESALFVCRVEVIAFSSLLVPCSSLNDPNNGMISCSLGDDGVLSYEDTCSFTCNTGYELTGSNTRTCQSDGSWSGSDDVCSRGNM